MDRGRRTYPWDVDGLVELAGADVLAGGVLVLGELDVAGRVALLRHCLPAAATRGTLLDSAKRGCQI